MILIKEVDKMTKSMLFYYKKFIKKTNTSTISPQMLTDYLFFSGSPLPYPKRENIPIISRPLYGIIQKSSLLKEGFLAS